jgi:hypothetical protein
MRAGVVSGPTAMERHRPLRNSYRQVPLAGLYDGPSEWTGSRLSALRIAESPIDGTRAPLPPARSPPL